MEKILYIQIDNKSLPEGCGEDIDVLDCRCINDFCSLVGDALVGDLKDENGKPLYRLINPVGKLLMDFKAVSEESFNSIIEDWYGILGILLHKGIQESDVSIKFPQLYVDWLLHNDNHYYEQVGKVLQRQNGKISFSSEAIDDDIIASLNYKVRQTLQEQYSFVVFSNPIIRNSSFVINRVKFDNIEFLRYNSWYESVKGNVNTQKNKEREEKSVEIVANNHRFKMVFVKGGQFLMGATSDQGHDRYEESKPVHPVTLSDFYIGETVVTQGLWKAVMGRITYVNIYDVGDSLPVCCKWDDCQEFISKLNKITGKKFRLPTEAEWEYAARGGNKSKGFKYAGSNNLEEVAWHGAYSVLEIHPVGEKKPNELGLYDMSGNVEEFCQDWYDEYNSFPAYNPKGPSSRLSDKGHVLRGGYGYAYHPSSCLVSSRSAEFYRDETAGLRLVMDL